MKVILQISGRKMTFTEVEKISILEEDATTEATENAAERPEEGKKFNVNPASIDQKLFEKKREDVRQEETRQLIQEAFTEVKEHPEKYAKPFQTMIPKKTWDSKTVDELKTMATDLGSHMADWVEQALEWAQRIHNGESWESICNEPDTANWYRLVVWKNGHTRLVGGSRNGSNNNPASDVNNYYYYSYSIIFNTVPLVVL